MAHRQHRGAQIVAWVILVVAVAAIIYAFVNQRPPPPPTTASQHGAMAPSGLGRERPA